MELSNEQLSIIREHREQQEPQERITSSDWMKQLQKTQNGRNISNAFNTLLIFQNDENLKGKFAYNLLSHKIEVEGKVPWKRSDTSSNEMTDYDDSCLRNYLSLNYDIKGKDLVYDTINQIVMENSYHPIRDYLNGLRGTWDGIPRLDTLIIDFFDAEDTVLNRYMSRLTFVGAVKRALEPGCKMDYVLVLKGPQGIGKSTFMQEIAVKAQWFSDSLDDIRGKEAKEQIQGKWIIELGEMAAVSKGDQKRLKQFITSTTDEFRQAYGRRNKRYPRQCIFVATTNDDLPLKDDTGGRRWWIIDVNGKWLEKDIPLEVDQIWAEAMYVFEEMKASGVPLKLPNHLEKEANRIQAENTDKGEFASIIEEVLTRGYIEQNTFEGIKKVPINETCSLHVWEKVLGRHRNDFSSARGREIKAILNSVDDWVPVSNKRTKFGDYGKQFVYRRKDH